MGFLPLLFKVHLWGLKKRKIDLKSSTFSFQSVRKMFQTFFFQYCSNSFMRIVRGVYNFLVVSHCNENLKQQTDQCYSSVLLGKTKASTPARSEGGPSQKMKRKEASILYFFYFCRLSPSWSFSHCHFGLLFPILTT